MLFPPACWALVPCVALVLTWLVSILSALRPAIEVPRARTRSAKVGIRAISLAARCRTAACSSTLNQGLEKIQAARAFDFAPILALSSNWEKEFLAPSMARSSTEALNIVCYLGRNGKLDDVPQDNKQRGATTFLRDDLFLSGTLLDRSPHVPPGFLVVFASGRFRSRKLPLACSVTNYIRRILLDRSPYGPPRSWDPSAVIKLRTFCLA